MRTFATAALVFFFAAILPAQGDDEFKRERSGRGNRDELKDGLEGKAPPALQVTGWMNAPGKGHGLSDLKGKVVVLDFWGVW